MNNSYIQHYISSLHGSLSAGEAVLLDREFVLTDDLRSNVATILKKVESSCSSRFLLNFYVLPTKSSTIEIPPLPVPNKRTYISFPSQEVFQTKYVSEVPEDRLKSLAYLVNEDDILSGRKAFCVGMSDCYFLRFRVETNLTLEPMKDFSNLDCRSLTKQTWSIRLKLYRVIMEALNTKSLNSAYKRHKTIDFAEWEWLYFSQCFLVDRAVEQIGTVTHRVNRSDGSKESCKVKTQKFILQFTTSDDISTLKKILGSTITVSTRNGFPTAPKRLRVGDDYIFSKQNASDSDFVNAILPDDDADANSPNGYWFLWTRETDKLRVTTQWEKLKITNQLVRDELRRLPAPRRLSDDSSSREDGILQILVGDDFEYDLAQFEIQHFVGDTLCSCIIIESKNGNRRIGQFENFSREFVQTRMLDNY